MRVSDDQGVGGVPHRVRLRGDGYGSHGNRVT